MSDRRFDWLSSHARLETALRALESGARLSPEAEVRILADRARKAALPLGDVIAAAGNAFEALVFERAGERYGVDALHVVEALPAISPAPLPGAHAFLVGVIHHRGQIVAVFDLRALRDTPGPGLLRPAQGQVVIVEFQDMCFGFLADQVGGTVRVRGDELSSGLLGDGQSWIRGTSAEAISILDLEAFARDSRVAVNDD